MYCRGIEIAEHARKKWLPAGLLKHRTKLGICQMIPDTSTPPVRGIMRKRGGKADRDSMTQTAFRNDVYRLHGVRRPYTGITVWDTGFLVSI